MSKPTHLISAKLTTEAFEIYNRYKARRRGGHAISSALLLLDEDAKKMRDVRIREDELYAEVRRLSQGIRNLQKVITRVHIERDELAEELANLFTPAYPFQRLESAETDLDSESS